MLKPANHGPVLGARASFRRWQGTDWPDALISSLRSDSELILRPSNTWNGSGTQRNGQSDRAVRERLGLMAALLLLATPEQSKARPVLVGLASESVSQLPGVLNVAALYCRKGENADIAEAILQLQQRHGTFFAAAFAERRRYGVGAFDRHMTQLYNHFANQHSMARYCHAAAIITDWACTMDSESLANAALGFLADFAGLP